MRLITGITHLLPEWKIVIQQIGLPFEVVYPRELILTDQFSVIIVTKKGIQSEKDILLQYINSGGSILIEAHVAHWLFDIEIIPAFVSTIESSEDTIFNGVLPGFIQTKLSLPKKTDVLEDESGKKLVQVYTSGEGKAVILPGGFTNTILDARVRRRNFSTRALYLPSERVGRISKHTIREVIQKSLEHLHFVRQLPFLCLSPFPEGQQSIFNFRIDTDFASEEAINSFYQLCLNHNISATWFIETKSAKNRMKQFANMKNQEIGLHCYQHKISDNYSFNKSDINEGINILKNASIPFCGYAAPYGEWNIPLANIIEQEEFTYSSEFTLDYDNLPFFPYLNGHFSSVLQVPVHPISLGRLKNARHSENDIINYYNDVIQERVDHNLPVFIYDHPSLENVNIMNWLIGYIHQKKLKSYSLRDYVLWWKKRLEIQWMPNFKKGSINIQWKNLPCPTYLLIKKSPQASSIIKTSTTINLNEIKWEKKKFVNKPTVKMSVRLKANRKMIINNILYLYRRLTQ